MDKAEELKKVREAMETDKTLPLVTKPEDIIPGDGNPDTILMFIGEAGGYHESIQRKPFVGVAGKLLDRGLAAIKIPRTDVYISNMVKTRPPENRDPTLEELDAFGKYLDQEIEIIKPKVIVTLGRFSMGKFLPGVKISSVHGKTYKINWKGREITIVPMYHPAAALRRGDVMEQFRNDFLKLPDIIKEASKPTVEQASLL
ncbi:uracil-DNA glycosylase [Candidatus Woesebacteria bacterium]|nr:uracil-DNA glycosylase [Candidatus Woesebacteria bacterium]